MPFLTDAMREMGITIEDLARRLGRRPEEIRAIAESGSDEEQLEAWGRYAVAVNDELILKPRLDRFYSKFMPNEQRRKEFIHRALNAQGTNIPRRMVNTVERLVQLAMDIEVIRRRNDGLKVFFLATCIEALYSLAGRDGKTSELLVDFFSNYIDLDGQRVVLDKVKRSTGDDRFDRLQRRGESRADHLVRLEANRHYTQEIDMCIFGKIVAELRNRFAHGGIDWEFSFSDGKRCVLNNLVLTEYLQERRREERVYDVSLSLDELMGVCVAGFVCFIEKHMATIGV